MELSTYQKKIVDWVKNGEGHGCCNAVAGSGKSTTLRLAAIALQESGISTHEVRVIVFGKANALDLAAQFGTGWQSSIGTLHSAGFRLLRKELKTGQGIQVITNKYRKIAANLGYIDSPQQQGSLKRSDALAKESDFTKLIDLTRLTNRVPEPETIRNLCHHFEITDVWEYGIVATAIAHCLEQGEREAITKKNLDFTDQIWLPVKWQLGKRKEFKPYCFVLVDECQDLNTIGLELSLMLAGETGRMLFVGDPRQAIMGFAGADNRSYQNILERTRAIELPLSICYRCPGSHIELIKKIYPEIPIEAHPKASGGTITQIEENELDKSLKTGDMVLSRKTAPLVSLCIKLIARGIAATVKGKAIGDQIKEDLKAIGKIRGFSYGEFNQAIKIYRAAKIARYKGKDNEEQLIETLNDKLMALETIYRSNPQATSIAGLETYIDNLFSDDRSPITLSTCHRAKGLENERIFIIKPEDLPMTWRNQLDWQKEQENNLLYVALTRSKSELFIVGHPSWYSTRTEKPTISPITNQATTEPPTLPTTGRGAHDEKRENVTAALLDSEWQKKSDRAIAEHCGVSAAFVGKMRRRINQSVTERLDRRGRVLETRNIGMKPKKSTKDKIVTLVKGMKKQELLELSQWLHELAEKLPKND